MGRTRVEGGADVGRSARRRVRGTIRVNVLIWGRSQWDRVAGFALIAAGAIAIVLGYIGVSDSPYVAEELAYIISGGIGGLFLLGVGAALLISADLHDEWRKLDRIEDVLVRRAKDATPPAAKTGAASGNGDARATGIRERTGALGALLVRADAIRSSALWPGNGTAFSSARFRRALGLAAAGLLACLAAIIAGWNHAAGVADPDPAIDAVGVAVGALIASGLIAAMYTFWLKRAVHARMSRLLGPIALAEFIAELPATATTEKATPPPAEDASTIEAASPLAAPTGSRRRAGGNGGKRDVAPDTERRPFAYVSPAPVTAVREAPAPAERVWVADGLAHFHRAGCILLRGTDAREIDRTDADPGLAACGICQA
jgi:hypothetical protein